MFSSLVYVGMKCIITEDFLNWFNSVPSSQNMDSLLKLGDPVKVIYVSDKRQTAIIQSSSGASCGGVPFEIIEAIRIKRED